MLPVDGGVGPSSPVYCRLVSAYSSPVAVAPPRALTFAVFPMTHCWHQKLDMKREAYLNKGGDSADDSEPEVVDGEGAPVVVELPKSKKELKAERKRARAAPSAADVALATRGVVVDAVTSAAVIASDDDDDEDAVAAAQAAARKERIARAAAAAAAGAGGSGSAGGVASVSGATAAAVAAARADVDSGAHDGGGKVVFKKSAVDDGPRKKPKAGAAPSADTKRKNVLSFDQDDV